MQSDRTWYSKFSNYKLQAFLALRRIVRVLEPNVLNVREEQDGAEEESAAAHEASLEDRIQINITRSSENGKEPILSGENLYHIFTQGHQRRLQLDQREP